MCEIIEVFSDHGSTGHGLLVLCFPAGGQIRIRLACGHPTRIRFLQGLGHPDRQDLCRLTPVPDLPARLVLGLQGHPVHDRPVHQDPCRQARRDLDYQDRSSLLARGSLGRPRRRDLVRENPVAQQAATARACPGPRARHGCHVSSREGHHHDRGRWNRAPPGRERQDLGHLRGARQGPDRDWGAPTWVRHLHPGRRIPSSILAERAACSMDRDRLTPSWISADRRADDSRGGALRIPSRPDLGHWALGTGDGQVAVGLLRGDRQEAWAVRRSLPVGCCERGRR